MIHLFRYSLHKLGHQTCWHTSLDQLIRTESVINDKRLWVRMTRRAGMETQADLSSILLT